MPVKDNATVENKQRQGGREQPGKTERERDDNPTLCSKKYEEAFFFLVFVLPARLLKIKYRNK